LPRRRARAGAERGGKGGQPGAGAPPRVDLIGPGRLGTALAAWLAAPRTGVAGAQGADRRRAEGGGAGRGSGGKAGGTPAAAPELDTVVSREARRARALAWRYGARRGVALAAYQPAGDIVLLAAPDDALPELAAELVRRAGARDAWRGRVVLHCSGLLPAAVLQPLRRQGAEVGSMHPLMTFGARQPAPEPGGLVFAVEGQKAAVRAAERLVAAWGGTTLRLRAREKAQYHLAAMWASPFVVADFAIAVAVLRRAGLRGRRLVVARRGLAALLARTAANVGAAVRSPRGDLADAWTGPIARSDQKTVRRHLAAAGEWGELYRAMAQEARRRLP
jgi:predicted short-subunit dehydrogenase-like oxidoreductase (DUF2520 family)